MQLIKKEGAYAIFESDNELHFVDYGTQSSSIVTFVFLLIGVILYANGIYWIFSNWHIGLPFLIIGALIFFANYLIFLNRKKKQNAGSYQTLLIIDLNQNVAFNGQREQMGHLKECHFSYSFQVTSSAKKLVFNFSKGRMNIAKGNPFKGYNRPFKNELKELGLM